MLRFFPVAGALALAVSIVGPVAAENHRYRPDFTFKRIAAPQPGTTPRITVQIAPRAQSAPPAAAAVAPDAATEPAREAAYAWFWDDVSPEISASGPGRLDEGLRALRNGPGGTRVASPRLDALRGIAADHGTDILLATVGTDVSPALVVAVISVESSGRADAVSGAGAEGLMQLMPATAARFGVNDSMVPEDNIKGGVAYLDWLLGQFDGDPILALAGYNAGEGAVQRSEGVPNYAETRDYVPKVLAAFSVAKGLCNTPPVLISDGCVFNVGSNDG